MNAKRLKPSSWRVSRPGRFTRGPSHTQSFVAGPWIWGQIACLLVALAGCNRSDSTALTSSDAGSPSQFGKQTDLVKLQADLEAELRYTLENRRLNTTEHGAWQILHGVLAYKLEFPVIVDSSGTTRSAVEYAMDGGQIEGWDIPAW